MKSTPDNSYLNLSINAPARLAHLKRANPEDWRKARRYGFGNWRAAYCAGLNQGFNGEGRARVAVWYSHDGEQFRGERFADEVVRMGYTGWYTHHEGYTGRDGTGLARGIVARLPHGRFIAGYWWGDNGERVYFPEVYTDEEDAARDADHYAERFAEMCREDSYKADEARKLQDEDEEKRQRLRECLALRNRGGCFAGLRDEARDILERLRTIAETLRTEYAEYV